jgi:hemerythrin superfamily protein
MRTSPRATESRATEVDAIALLKADHRNVSSLLEEFETADGRNKSSIAQKICAELSVHAQIEEEIFYPAAREVLDESDLIDEADVEHATLKGLVGRIESTASTDDHYDALVKVLGEYVKHHVKEEEGQIFPKVRSNGMDVNAVGAELARRKEELTNKTV